MANTVTILGYTNTFTDWLVGTNALIRENNDFAANTYVKPTGTLFLNEPTLGLQVANNAVIAGQLQVQGIGSSAFIQNNLLVGGQVYFSNTTLGLTNSGQAIFNGQVSANGSNNGLFVANNTVIGGRLNVGSSGNFGSNVSIGTSANVGSFLNVGANTRIGTNLTVGDIIYNGNKIFTSTLDANTSIFTTTLNATQAQITGQLTVGGNFVLTGATIYNSNNFVINAGSGFAINSQFAVNRGTSGANASILWEESSKSWKFLDVDNGLYYRILSDEYISNSSFSNSSSNIATSAAVFSANTFLQANTGAALASARSYTDASNTSIRSYVDNRANSLVQTAFVNVGANGVTLTATSNTDTLTITSATANGINVLNPASKTIDIGLRNSGVTPTTYGNTTSIPSITVDAFGRITSASNTSITIPPSTSIIANSGQLTANAATGIVALGLADTTVVAGSYGSSTQIPSFNVDSKGRLTSVSNNPISVATASGYLANTIIVANSTGVLSNSTVFFTLSNNTIIASNIAVSGIISTPRFRAYTEAVNVVTSITSATYNIDLSQGNIFDLTVNTNITFTFTNPPPAGTMMTATVILKQDAVGSRLCTFTGARYTDAEVPPLTTLPNKMDVLTFSTTTGGTIYFGSLAMANVALI